MKHPPSAHEIIEAFGKLLGPRRFIVSLLRKLNNEYISMTCKGDFPFPFQALGQHFELEVTVSMQEIEFYCKKCRKTMKMSYELTGDKDAPVMNGISFRCHTNKCTRVVTLKKYTEGKIIQRAGASGRCYL